MIFTELKNLSEGQKHQIIELWNKEYPRKLFYSKLTEFDQYLNNLADKHHIILSDESGKVKGWLVYFIRNKERWFAMILDSSVQGQGWGSKFLDLAKQNNTELNGWVIDKDTELKQNGEIYKSPIGFYEKNGFQILSDTHIIFKDLNGIKVRWKR